MTGSSKKTKDAKALHFFRIILGHDQKLGLPKRFVRRYGNDLSNSVMLAAPNGAVWRVELIKSDGEIWLGHGWKDFAHYFSLKHGNLLVFRYEGHSHFCVLMIFDQSTVEIEYPINISSSEDANPKVEEIQSDASVEIIHDISTPSACFSPCKRMRTRLSTRLHDTWNVKKSAGTGGKFIIPPAKEGGRVMSAAERSRPSNKRNARASSRASDFKSENPFFKVVIRPSHLTGYHLHIPLAFARTYFTQKQDDIILQDLDGKTWSVHFKVYGKNGIVHLVHGWHEFVVDHSLKVGDTCAFELLLEGLEKISFRVTIVRVVEDANDHITAGYVKRKGGFNTRSLSESDCSSEDKVITSWPTAKESLIKTEHRKLKQVMQNETTARRDIGRLSSQGTAGSGDRESKIRSNNPVFKVDITESFLRNAAPTIPKSFCEDYIKRIPQVVTFKFKGKSWCVRLFRCVDRPGKFGAGWWEFASENKLQVGDACIFEMTKRTNIVFEVSIFRGSRSLG